MVLCSSNYSSVRYCGTDTAFDSVEFLLFLVITLVMDFLNFLFVINYKMIIKKTCFGRSFCATGSRTSLGLSETILHIRNSGYDVKAY